MKKKILLGILIAATGMNKATFAQGNLETTLKGGVTSIFEDTIHTDGVGYNVELELASRVSDNFLLGMEFGVLENNFYYNYTSVYAGVLAKLFLNDHLYLKGSVGAIFGDTCFHTRNEDYYLSNDTIYFGAELGFLMDNGLSVAMGAKMYDVTEEYYYNGRGYSWEEFTVNGYVGLGYTF